MMARPRDTGVESRSATGSASFTAFAEVFIIVVVKKARYTWVSLLGLGKRRSPYR